MKFIWVLRFGDQISEFTEEKIAWKQFQMYCKEYMRADEEVDTIVFTILAADTRKEFATWTVKLEVFV